MSLSTFFILIFIGLTAGMLGGLIGVGGGLIIVPALVFFLGMTQHQAQGTSLGVIVLPVGILAVINYYKQGQINFNYSLVIAASFILGGYLGSKVAIALDQQTLKRIFGGLMLVISIKMLIGK